MVEKEDTFQPTSGHYLVEVAPLEVSSLHTLASLFTASIGHYPYAQHLGRAQGQPDE